ncbi:LOB domain-containing protein 37-like [Cocos nucifera]|uniref:LOB domain-containing protein 37-like n=1 Tax=Cocos nucifera TaxID=13894 RepID=A0A8K0N3D5_COCNU|nr:LOB domain-containing protein 37-like [Cocos nucifera]
MSCNGCRVLRKGCSDTCILRPCLDWIESAEAQAHATVFVAKFFGRAGLMSFLSSVPSPHRPSLFRSLLFEACGRTINPVSGAVGLQWTRKWHLCQAAVETVLCGGALRPLPDLAVPAGEVEELYGPPPKIGWTSSEGSPLCDLDLCLMPRSPTEAGEPRRRAATPSRNSEESVTTSAGTGEEKPALLNLFV